NEKVEKHIKEVNNFGDAKFGEFLDRPERLQDMTNKILDVLVITKMEILCEHKNPVINEGTYVCEILTPFLNTVMVDLPGDKASSASAERKDSYKSARKSDFSVKAKIKDNTNEIGYFETG
ncbi:24553_t:CDS:2, partial [Gigaspora rosea]